MLGRAYDDWKLMSPDDEYNRRYGTPVADCIECLCDLRNGDEVIKDREGNIFCSDECYEEFHQDDKIYIVLGDE